MTIQEVIRAVPKGKGFKRKNQPSIICYVITPESVIRLYLKEGSRRTLPASICAVDDLLANDWEIVEI